MECPQDSSPQFALQVHCHFEVPLIIWPACQLRLARFRSGEQCAISALPSPRRKPECSMRRRCAAEQFAWKFGADCECYFVRRHCVLTPHLCLWEAFPKQTEAATLHERSGHQQRERRVLVQQDSKQCSWPLNFLSNYMYMCSCPALSKAASKGWSSLFFLRCSQVCKVQPCSCCWWQVNSLVGFKLPPKANNWHQPFGTKKLHVAVRSKIHLKVSMSECIFVMSVWAQMMVCGNHAHLAWPSHLNWCTGFASRCACFAVFGCSFAGDSWLATAWHMRYE